MLDTSKKYKECIYAPERRTEGKIVFEILDKTAYTDGTITLSEEENLVSIKKQLTNDVREKGYSYITWERDYFKLDGSSVMTPIALIETSEVGWWSKNLTDANGVFTTMPTVDIKFNSPHTSLGFSLHFDKEREEYANEFDVEITLADNSVLKKTVLNDKTVYNYGEGLNDYKRIVIKIKRWSKPFRRARIVEIDFGLVKEYSNNELISLNLVKELDSTSGKLPADELKFTVDNSNREFNVLNPRGFYAYLKQGQECKLQLGLDTGDTVEYLQVGEYYLRDWQSDEGTLTASFTLRDIIDTLSTDEIEGTELNRTSLYDLAEKVFKYCGIEKYEISSDLKESYTLGLFEKTTYKKLLQLIAIAGRCVIYTDNLGIVHLKRLISAKQVLKNVSVSNEDIIGEKEQLINNILDPDGKYISWEKNRFKLDSSFVMTPAATDNEVGWWSSTICDEEGMFNPSITITLELSGEHTSQNFEFRFDVLNKEYGKDLTIIGYDKDGSILSTENIMNDSPTFSYQNSKLKDFRKIEIKINSWSKPNRRARISEIGFDLPVDRISLYDAYSEPKITLGAYTKKVELTYQSIQGEKQLYTIINPDVSTGQTLSLTNTLINTEIEAQKVAKWLLEENNRIATYDVDYRGNPALEMADKISIENGYGSSQQASIIKHELSYDGALRGKILAKGETSNEL